MFNLLGIRKIVFHNEGVTIYPNDDDYLPLYGSKKVLVAAIALDFLASVAIGVIIGVLL